MFSCLRQTLNRNSTYRIYNKRFYSGLYSCSRTSISKNNSVHDDKGGIFSSKYKQQQQCRSLSDDSFLSRYYSFFDSIASSAVSTYLKDTIIQVHDVTGLPWWGTIILTTGVLKLCLGLPPSIYQHVLLSRLVLCKEEVKKKSKSLMDEVLKNAILNRWSKEKAKIQFALLSRKEYMALVVKNNCHPFKNTILSLSQLPIWLLMSVTLRKMAQDMSLVTDLTSEYGMTALQLQLGGLFWCENLLLPDKTLILPILLTVLGLILIEVNILAAKTEATRIQSKIIVNFFRFLTILAFPISMNMPSIVSLYWTTSICFGLCQNLLLLSPKVRRLCGIPKTSIEVEKPFSHIANKLRKRFERIPLISSKKKS